jgi:predicted nucleotidyltransferase
MTDPTFGNQFETEPTISSAPPAVESFASLALAEKIWPPEITQDAEFRRQLETRKVVNERLDVIVANRPRPDMSLAEAIAEKLLTEKQVADFYDSLADLFENEPEYKRLALYLPFEFLPSKDWQTDSKGLSAAARRFAAAYLAAWHNLLITHDVRANFVAGDILEADSLAGRLPRVVKAAHLIPVLVKKGLLSLAEVFDLLETSEDETLRRSIADTLPLLAAWGFIGHADLLRLEASADIFVREVAAEIETPKAEKIQSKTITLAAVGKNIHRAFEQIEAEKYSDITPSRERWLRQEKKRRAIETLGTAIKNSLRQNKLNATETEQFFAAETEPAGQQSFINGLRKAIEAKAANDLESARKFYAEYRELLFSFWKKNETSLHEELAKTFRRLHVLGIVDDQQLKTLGLTIPALAGPFSENLPLMKKEMTEIREIVGAMEKDPEMMKYIYPAVLVFGSRLKGFSSESSDIDVAIFIRPETSPSDQEKMRALLKKTFAHEKIQGKVVEFWLENTSGGFAVRNIDENDPAVAVNSWIYLLFGSAWEGKMETITELHNKLLVPYFYNQEKSLTDRLARNLYLEQLEHDSLQYRLMHKGYEKIFPPFGGLPTEPAERIDGQSMFWDSGYRQTATKLFARRVFLPKISRP